jgi:hypothetical protein
LLSISKGNPIANRLPFVFGLSWTGGPKTKSAGNKDGAKHQDQ